MKSKARLGHAQSADLGQWHVVHRQGRALSPVARVFRAHLLAQAVRVASG